MIVDEAHRLDGLSELYKNLGEDQIKNNNCIKMKHLRYFGIRAYSSRWYHVILWWELMRIPFNAFLAVLGMLSFYFGYVTIPLIYVITGMLINLLFSLSWTVELSSAALIRKIGRRKFRLIILFALLVLSTLIIFLLSLMFFQERIAGLI